MALVVVPREEPEPRHDPLTEWAAMHGLRLSPAPGVTSTFDHSACRMCGARPGAPHRKRCSDAMWQPVVSPELVASVGGRRGR